MRTKLPVAILTTAVTLCFGLAAAQARHHRGDPTPSLKSITCVTHCPSSGGASIGSGIGLKGSGLRKVTKVKFASADGGHVSAVPQTVTEKAVTVVVPDGAVTGPVGIHDSRGNSATSPESLEIVGADPTTDPSGGADTTPGSSGSIKLSRDKGFYKSRREVSAALGDATSDGSVEIVSADGEHTVAKVPVESGVARWDGVADDGTVADGEYVFRASSGAASDPFEQHGHIFPVRGRHTYGDGFGAGRGHDGQDVLADCGTKVVAARAGRIVASGDEGDMGNYLVLDGKQEKQTYVYMHLLDGVKVKKGDTVKTGQHIADVGETGNATACHLHFEIWNGAWQSGKVTDPAPTLTDWDKFS